VPVPQAARAAARLAAAAIATRRIKLLMLLRFMIVFSLVVAIRQ
jgi:hypothetical protein